MDKMMEMYTTYKKYINYALIGVAGFLAYKLFIKK